MKIVNKVKFVVRIVEIIIVIATIVLTIIGINYANELRGYQAYGGEYLIPIFGFLAIIIIEEIYRDYEDKKENNSKNKEDK